MGPVIIGAILVTAVLAVVLVMWLRRGQDIVVVPPAPPAQIGGDVPADVQTLLAQGKKIEAIKRVRELTGLGLKEAKDYVDALQRGDALPVLPATAASEAATASAPGLEQEVRGLLAAGRHRRCARTETPVRRLLIASIVLFVLGAPAASASAHVQPGLPDIPQQARDRAPIGAIAVDGDFVVWSELLQPNRFLRYANLYAAELATGRVTTIGEQLSQFHYWNTSVSPGFALDNETLVWFDHKQDGPDNGLVSTNLHTGEREQLAMGRISFPAIAGNLVSWWETKTAAPNAPAMNSAHLFVRDLAGNLPPRELTRIDFGGEAFLLAGGQMNAEQVVFLRGAYDNPQGSSACWHLWSATIGNGEAQQLADLGCPSGAQPQVALSDQALAFSDAAGLLHTRDLATGGERVSGPHGNNGLTWGRRYLFWSTSDGTVWGFDPAHESAFRVAGARGAAMGAGGGLLSYVAVGPNQGNVLQTRTVNSLLPTARRDPASPEAAERNYFPETGHTLGGDFRTSWQRNGGLPVFGFPLTEEFVQRVSGQPQGFTVQYLERQRFELHPENPEPYRVLLGRLGAEALAAQGRDWQSFPKADPATPGYFPQTGQVIAPEFVAAWRGRGLELGDPGVSEREALALWGYPLSPPQIEQVEGRPLLVQWFERARFEYHPENPDPYKVLVGRLAADTVTAFAWE